MYITLLKVKKKKEKTKTEKIRKKCLPPVKASRGNILPPIIPLPRPLPAAMSRAR